MSPKIPFNTFNCPVISSMDDFDSLDTLSSESNCFANWPISECSTFFVFGGAAEGTDPGTWNGGLGFDCPGGTKEGPFANFGGTNPVMPGGVKLGFWKLDGPRP